MSLSLKEAEIIAAQKAVELFGRDELRRYDGWNSEQNGVFCLSLGKQSETEINSPTPTIDETKPWREVTDILVNLEDGTVSVKKRENVTIFD